MKELWVRQVYHTNGRGKKYKENKHFKDEVYEVQYPLNNDMNQRSSNRDNKYFKWLWRASGNSGEASLSYHRLYMS